MGKTVTACIVICTAALAASFGYFSFPLIDAPVNIDSAVFQYVGRTIAEGGMPYLDAFDHKGPLIYLVNAVALLVGGEWGLWVIESLFLSATGIACFALARTLGAGRVMSCAVPILLLPYLVKHAEGGNLTEQFCFVFLLIVMISCIRISLNASPADSPPGHARKNARLRSGLDLAPDALAIGISLSALFLLRFTELLGALPFCLLALHSIVKARTGRGAILPAVFVLLGAVSLFAPIATWLLANGAFDEFVNDYLLFNAVYASDVEGASWMSSLEYFLSDVGVLLSLVTTLALLVADRLTVSPLAASDRCALLANLAALVLLFAVPAASGRLYGHYLLIIAPGFVVPAALALRALAAAPVRIGSGRTSLALFGIAAAFLLVCAPNVTNTVRQVTYQQGLAPQRAAVVEAARSVHKDGELLVVGNECWIYLDGGFTSPAPYAFRSDAMLETYNEWLFELIASPDAPATVVLAPYALHVADEIAGFDQAYVLAAESEGYLIYRHL